MSLLDLVICFKLDFTDARDVEQGYFEELEDPFKCQRARQTKYPTYVVSLQARNRIEKQ